MYAVVNTGGKQYKVQQGEILRVEKIPGEIGSPVTFDRVLMFSDGENVNIGQPLLDDIAVEEDALGAGIADATAEGSGLALGDLHVHVHQIIGSHELQRHPAIEPRIDGVINDSHTTTGDFTNQHIVADSIPAVAQVDR